MENEKRNDNAVGVAFVRNYFTLASRTHIVVARMLYWKLKNSKSVAMRKILITQLFEEYASTFETLGVMCRSIRNRFNEDFLTAFMTYSPGSAHSLYQAVAKMEEQFDAQAYLLLPTITQFTASTSNWDLIETYGASLPIATRQLREAAQMYSREDFVTRDIFLKLKHSSVFVDDPTITEQFVGNPRGLSGRRENNSIAYVLPGRSPSRILALRASDDFAHLLYGNVRTLSDNLRGLLLMTIQLDEAGLLYRNFQG